jgi:hypothetical protein
MLKRETPIQNAIRLRAGELGVHLFRNNVGACEDKSGRIIRYGLANDSKAMSDAIKSADLIGWTPCGRFLSVEVKHAGFKMPKAPKGRLAAQVKWGELIVAAGGVAGIVCSVEQFEQLLRDHGCGYVFKR